MDKAEEGLFDGVERDLLLELASQLPGEGLAGAPSPPEVSIHLAKRWMISRLGAIRLAICPHFQKLHTALSEDPATAVAAIADLISGLWAGVSPFIVAKVCIQVGLKHICVSASHDG